MPTETFIITSTTVKAGQIALTTTARILDMFRSQQCFRMEWTGPNYKKTKFLWWTTSESGEKMVFELRGKPAFCDAILNHLSNRDLELKDGKRIDAGKWKPLASG